MYKLSGTSDDGRPLSGEQTTYAKPPKRRTDTSVANSTPESVYELEDGAHWCPPQGVPMDCFRLAKDQAMFPDQRWLRNPEHLEATYEGARQIAGQQAHCYGVKPLPGASAEFTDGIFCATGEGVPLLSRVKAQGTDMTAEATSYSATVADADFQLPARVPSMFDIILAGPPPPYRIVYKVSATSGGQDATGEVTVYSRLRMMRGEMNFPNVAGGVGSVYNLEDGSYLCTSQGGARTCSRMIQDPTMPARHAWETDQPNYQGARQFAGQQGHCYGVKPRGAGPTDFAEGTFCSTAQDVPLFARIKAGGTDLTMEAISYSASVSDADFQLPVLPAEPSVPVEVPTLPGGIPFIPIRR